MSVPTTRYFDRHGEAFDLLPEGTRVRSKQHPELTGYIKHYEWHESGHISPIPYFIEWDDYDAVRPLLGFLAHFGSPFGIEPQP